MAKDFKQHELKNPLIASPFIEMGGQFYLDKPIFSRNYIQNKRGMRIDKNGEVELGDIKLVGGKAIGGAIASVGLGQDIQAAIERVREGGGGSVFCDIGTHLRKTDIILYENIKLQGLASEKVEIDFQNNNAGIRIVGDNAYTTGTVTVSNGSTAVVGTDTVWTSAMVGRNILLGGIWYPIAAFTDATHITIELPYGGQALSGDTYAIATIKEAAKIFDITVKNSNTVGIKMQYTNESVLNNVKTQQCAVGIDIDDSSNFDINEHDGIANTDDMQVTNCHFSIIRPAGNIDVTNHGFVFDTCSNMDLSALYSVNPGGAGVRFINCKDMAYRAISVTEAGGIGIEYVSNNNRIKGGQALCSGCASDGIKLTATTDDCSITDIISKDNGGYGINVAAATCDNNEINNPTISGNTSGAINDIGTGTNIRFPGGDATVNKEHRRMKNTSGGQLVAGDMVTLKAVAAGDEVTTTTTQGDDLVFGMVVETIANNAYGRIQILGKTTALKVDGTTDIAIGDFIGTFTTAKIGMKAAAGDMAIAIALEAYATDDSNGVIDALFITPRKI